MHAYALWTLHCTSLTQNVPTPKMRFPLLPTSCRAQVGTRRLQAPPSGPPVHSNLSSLLLVNPSIPSLYIPEHCHSLRDAVHLCTVSTHRTASQGEGWRPASWRSPPATRPRGPLGGSVPSLFSAEGQQGRAGGAPGRPWHCYRCRSRRAPKPLSCPGTGCELDSSRRPGQDSQGQSGAV